MAQYLRLRLSNGDTRHLDLFGRSLTEALDCFLRNDTPYDEEFVSTMEQTDVQRSQVVEVYEIESDDEAIPGRPATSSKSGSESPMRKPSRFLATCLYPASPLSGAKTAR